MNRMLVVTKIHAKDKLSWFYLPWIIMGASFAVNLVLSYIMEEPLYTGGLASIFIYVLIAGIGTVMQTFPFSLGLSVRRTDYVAGTAAMMVLYSACISLLLLGLEYVEKLTGHWGSELYFFDPFAGRMTPLEQFTLSFVTLLHLFYFGFVIASVYRRFGRNGMSVLMLASFLLASVCSVLASYLGWWIDIFGWFGKQTFTGYVLWQLPFIFVYMLASYLMLRRASV